MPTLADALQLEVRHEFLVTQCVGLIQQRIADRGVLSRIPLQTAVSLLESIRPQGLRDIVSRLLPDFTQALEPLYQRFLESNQTQFSPFLQTHSEQAVAALLGVADACAAQSANGAIRMAYRRLRPGAVDEVRAVLPALAELLSMPLGGMR
ncbi:DUF6918 family protein [Panacagrimonas sp.]|uniref:DUF6918 family protein n=1 Tax=Panacagrimonas sp. TaxID=2480088 RepID=UPI003B520514